jgi:hypothetical protein
MLSTKKKLVSAVIIVAVVVIGFSLYSWDKNKTAGALTAPVFTHVVRQSETALTLTWQKNSGADGYEVYEYDSSLIHYTKAATIRNSNKTKWTNKNLTTGKKYHYIVRAYVRTGFTKKFSDFSYDVSAVPYERDAKTVNASTDIRLRGPVAIEIGLKQKIKIEATVQPAKFGTAKDKEIIDSSIRLVVNDSFVTKEGEDSIIGNKVGTTTIYAVTHNGNSKTIRVNVVDYSRPGEWINIDRVSNKVAGILIDQRENLVNVFSYLSQYNEKDGSLKLGYDGKLINSSNITLDGIDSNISQLLSDCPSDATIYTNADGVMLRLVWYDDTGPLEFLIYYNIQDDVSQTELDKTVPVATKIAPHWSVLFTPLGD